MTTILHYWRAAGGAAGPEAKMQDLRRRVEALGGRRTEDWRATVTLLQRTLNNASRQALHNITLPDAPDRSFLLLTKAPQAAAPAPAAAAGASASPSRPNSRYALLDCARGGLQLLDQSKTFQRKLEHVLDGAGWALGDFHVRLGVTKHRDEVIAHVVFVTYAPCVLTDRARTVVSDFLKCLSPEHALQSAEVDYEDLGLGATFTQRHLALQVARMSNKLVAAPAAAAAPQ